MCVCVANATAARLTRKGIWLTVYTPNARLSSPSDLLAKARCVSEKSKGAAWLRRASCRTRGIRDTEKERERSRGRVKERLRTHLRILALLTQHSAHSVGIADGRQLLCGLDVQQALRQGYAGSDGHMRHRGLAATGKGRGGDGSEGGGRAQQARNKAHQNER